MLSARQAVLQSQIIHPDWTAETHLVWLDGEAYDLAAIDPGKDPVHQVRQWMQEHVAAGAVAEGRSRGYGQATVTAYRFRYYYKGQTGEEEVAEINVVQADGDVEAAWEQAEEKAFAIAGNGRLILEDN